ncbi:hypothetical protein E1B28_006466 [Marasmius oreades]|uniref:Glycoside hydrolase family 43 protein n=1 Tax=Marasmius oreades TaxID=181124 RepID=A0A9P7UW64_9AGAR|nr:uncharacterized protein E1B28_006466 [Marasmius oreades]KAG7095761.1 hypothetical protein E1B28_006466 [Marasmius oreades]
MRSSGSLGLLAVLLSFAFNILASPLATPENTNTTIASRADSSKVGYFFVHFYDRQPAIFAHLSNGNNPTSYKALNADRAILVPTGGTKAARDPYLVSAPDDSRHFIIATDLDINAIGGDWGRAVSQGSKSLHIWESTDLVNWDNYRLVQVIGSTAGMAWAPEAVWDSSRGAFLVHWASRLYAASDTAHTGTATRDQIMYAYTNDFRTFTAAQPYIAASWPVIDLTILSLGGSSYARFVKDETINRIYEERSNNGLFGTWTRVGGSSAVITTTTTEGPLVFQDNRTPGLVHLFLDAYTTAAGYVPFQTNNIDQGPWTASSTSGFPTLLKHGVVKPVNQAQYNAIQAKWP